MTIWTLIFYIAIAATILTGMVVSMRKQKNIIVSFLQNFTGALFIFSGVVKAIDPLGTAYKMEQYFAAFETTFETTWFSFISGIFPWLSSMSYGFSVFMIVLEIAIGALLILGGSKRFTSWAFLLLIGFFTALTGYTYLTGYVPSDVNFFSFGGWSAYDANNMQVTDCGCFGDFLKLEPRVSFMKDIFLLIPAFIFVFKHKDMHEFGTAWGRIGMSTAIGLLSFLFCYQNSAFDLPVVDFRPFHEQANIRTEKQHQIDSVANAPFEWIMKNKETGETKQFPQDEYPSEPWEYVDRDQDEIKTDKIYDFEVADLEGNDMTEAILSDDNYSFMIVSYSLSKTNKDAVATKINKMYDANTVGIAKKVKPLQDKVKLDKDSLAVLMSAETPDSAQVATMQALIAQQESDIAKLSRGKYHFYTVAGGATQAEVDEFRHALQAEYEFYQADDILLKTIVRSNPGIVLLKNGEIVKKWHHKKVPTFEEIEAEYMVKE